MIAEPARYNDHMTDGADEYLNRLRGWRTRPGRYSSLAFMADQFKRTIEKPHKQLGDLATIWQKAVPDELCRQTALHSFSRGTLRVTVADSGVLYELDRRLRGGLEREIRSRYKGKLLRVKLAVGPVAK